MDPELRRAICSKGGKAAHALGRAYQFDSAQARVAGRKGGVSVSRDTAHMSRIGQKGGKAVSADRAHMARIGAKGGRIATGVATAADFLGTPIAPEVKL